MNNLHEYAFALRVCRELPEILTILEEFKAKMEPYKTYRTVGEILETVKDCESESKQSFLKYQKIRNNKGDINVK